MRCFVDECCIVIVYATYLCKEGQYSTQGVPLLAPDGEAFFGIAGNGFYKRGSTGTIIWEYRVAADVLNFAAYGQFMVFFSIGALCIEGVLRLFDSGGLFCYIYFYIYRCFTVSERSGEESSS